MNIILTGEVCTDGGGARGVQEDFRRGAHATAAGDLRAEGGEEADGGGVKHGRSSRQEQSRRDPQRLPSPPGGNQPHQERV